MAFDTVKPPCDKVEKKAGCIQSTLNVLGDKWTPLLLGQLVSGQKTFGNLEVKLAGISPRTLSARLTKLETEGIIDRILYHRRPPRYRYELTAKGRELQTILIKMADWGEKYGT